MNRYIEEGKRSFHQNKGIYQNPYELYSDAYNQFERGWKQEHNLASDDLLRRYSKEANRFRSRGDV